MVATFTARFNDSVTVTSRYISYRTRVIDGSVICEFRVKGRKVCINSYKQNGQFPTMCVHMATHDDAMMLYNSMMAHWYPSDEDGEADEEEGQAELDEGQAELDEDEAELEDQDDDGEGEAELDEDEADEAELEEDDEDMPPLIPVQTPLYHYWYKTMAF